MSVVKYKSKEMELKKNYLVPGQRVSVDHFQSDIPGRLYNSKGRTDAKDMFCGGCIFMDHSYRYIQVRHQVTISSNKTIKAVFLYKHYASNNGVFIQAYHDDNGVFTSKNFMDSLIEKEQHISFSGYGADHQNGVSERVIQTVTQMDRTIPIHSAMRIP